MISSLTASPSEDDWKASAGVLLSFPLMPLFVIFLLVNFVSIQFNINFMLLVLAVISIVFMYVVFGVILLICLVAMLKALSLLFSSISGKVSGARNDR
jgi:hypothetical protein